MGNFGYVLAAIKPFDYVVGIFLILAAIALVVLVLMQEGKSKNLSGAIAGGADTFFGKQKGKTMSKMLSTVTTVLATLFAVIVLAVYIAQPNPFKMDYSVLANITDSDATRTSATTGTSAVETEVETSADTATDTNGTSETTPIETEVETSADTAETTPTETEAEPSVEE